MHNFHIPYQANPRKSPSLNWFSFNVLSSNLIIITHSLLFDIQSLSPRQQWIDRERGRVHCAWEFMLILTRELPFLILSPVKNLFNEYLYVRCILHFKNITDVPQCNGVIGI